MLDIRVVPEREEFGLATLLYNRFTRTTLSNSRLELTKTPASVSDELFADLRREFSEPQLVELATAIAWENHRARFNRAFGIAAEGFSEGAFCPLPEHP
jgi:alkylhydroperoxidase family enzyme